MKTPYPPQPLSRWCREKFWLSRFAGRGFVENPWLIAGGSFVLGIVVGVLGLSLLSGGDPGAGPGSQMSASAGPSPLGRGSGALPAEAGAQNLSNPGSADGASPDATAERLREVFHPEPHMVLERLMTELETDEDLRGMSVLARIQQLKDMGDEGLRVIADFLGSYQDIEFGENMGRFGRRFPSLRAVLIDSLEGVDSPIALEANLEVLQNSPFLYETVMAASNLQDVWPGEYNEQAVRNVGTMLSDMNEKLASDPETLDEWQTRRGYYSAVRYITDAGATELLPTIEQGIAITDQGAGHYVMQIGRMDVGTQKEVLNRMLGDPRLREQILDSPWGMGMMNLSDPELRDTTVALAINEMTPEQQGQLIRGLDHAGRGGRRRHGGGDETPEERVQRISGAQRTLEQLNPHLSPDLQENAQDALRKLNRRMNNIN
jgi:hypothetical protein